MSLTVVFTAGTEGQDERVGDQGGQGNQQPQGGGGADQERGHQVLFRSDAGADDGGPGCRTHAHLVAQDFLVDYKKLCSLKIVQFFVSAAGYIALIHEGHCWPIEAHDIGAGATVL